MKTQKPAKKPTGPTPDRIKIEGPWEQAVEAALGKKRPKEGWPKAPKSVKKMP